MLWIDFPSMNEKLALVLDYVKQGLLWCRRNPKIVSSFVLLLLVLIALIIGFSTRIPDIVGKREAKQNDLRSFNLNRTQLEWVVRNCQQIACIQQDCMCLTRRYTTWMEASDLCFSQSGLPDAKLFTPIKVEEKGMFHTYKNLLSFLSFDDKYIRSLWTGLHREFTVSVHHSIR